ncbi:MAG: hypothetical protein M3413_03265 [Bacteroidota bacterium]|nr:hypothetical protein [Bacteroidota bacterium]
MITRFTFILAILFIFSFQALSQEAKAEADKQKIVIGEQIELRLQALIPKTISPEWIELDSFPHFEILSKSKIDTIQDVTHVIFRQTFTITSWDSGSRVIPSFRISGFRTTPIPVEVGFSPFDPSQPYHDVKDIIEVPAEKIPKWHWYLILLALLIIIFSLLFPKRKKKKEAEFVPDTSVYKQSLKQLEKLKKEHPEPKIFYTELVQILRNYLNKRRGVQSFSKTTDDLVIYFSDAHLSSAQTNTLLQTLRLSDLVKYAKFHPDKGDDDLALETIREAIMSLEKNTKQAAVGVA